MFGRGIKTALFLAVAASTLTTSAMAVGKTSIMVGARNDTKRYVWFDVSESHKMRSDWSIVKAFCLAPGEKGGYNFSHDYSDMQVPQLRVRAELKEGDCRSGNWRVLEAREEPAHGRTWATTAVINDDKITFYSNVLR